VSGRNALSPKGKASAGTARNSRAIEPEPLRKDSENPLLALQRSAGNRASTAFLNQAAGAPDVAVPFSLPVPIETDEAEADALADRIDAVVANPPAPPSPPGTGGGDPGSSGPPPPADPGSGLPRPLRDWLERLTGHDLSDVRIRADARAAAAAERLGAQAFTAGREIYFAAGGYSPATRAGARLVAHEVAHTVQQAQGGARGPQLKPKKPAAAETVAKVQRITFYIDTGLVVFELSDGTSATTDATYNGRPNPNTYAVRRQGDHFPAPATAGGQPNDKNLIIGWITPTRATFDGVNAYTLRVLGGKPGQGGVVGGTGGGGGESGGVGGASGAGGGTKDSAQQKGGPDKGTGKGDQPTPPPLTPEEAARWQELYAKLTGGKSTDEQDPRELLRLYQILRDKVEDPTFSKTQGEPWDRFAKFLDQNKGKIEGILQSGEDGKLTQAKIEKIIAEYQTFVAGEPWTPEEKEQLKSFQDFDKEFAYDPGWQRLSKADKKLLLEYSKMSPDELSKAKVDFSRVTVDMKVGMALKLSWKSWPAEVAEAAKTAFTDPSFIITLVVTMAIYVGLWLTPDPSAVTKVLAGTLTAVLLTQFAWSDIVGFAVAWSDLIDACAVAKTVPELQAAGDRFAKKVGQVGFDIILMLVMWRIGKRVGPKVQKIGAARGVVRAEAGVRTAEAAPGSGRVPKSAEGAANPLDTAKAQVDAATAQAAAAGPTTTTGPTTAEPGTTTTTGPTTAEPGTTSTSQPPAQQPATTSATGPAEPATQTATGPPVSEPGSTTRTAEPGPGQSTTTEPSARGPAAPAPETAVLDALSRQLPSDAQSALAEFRSKVGDANALKALEGARKQGLDLSRFLTEKTVPPEVRAKARAELLNAEAKLARAKIIEAEVAKDPALRKAVIEEHGGRLRMLLNELGILDGPDVQKLAKQGALNELVGVLGEALQRQLLGTEFPASKGNRVISNLAIVRRVPGFRSIAEWAEARRAAGIDDKVVSKEAAKLFEKDGVVYEAQGEVDSMVTEPGAGGKLRPTLIEEAKTGAADRPSAARAQAENARAALKEAGTNPEVRVFERPGKQTLGADVTNTLELGAVEATQVRARGPAGKGFDTELGYDNEVLTEVAKRLISEGLPPKAPQPAVAPVPQRKREPALP